jgi:hypothetical protein
VISQRRELVVQGQLGRLGASRVLLPAPGLDAFERDFTSATKMETFKPGNTDCGLAQNTVDLPIRVARFVERKSALQEM